MPRGAIKMRRLSSNKIGPPNFGEHTLMTNSFLAMLLVMAMAMLGVCLLASAADLVSPKLSPRAFGPRKP